MAFSRSGVIVIEAMIASTFLAFSAGISPSNDWLTISHSAPICAQSALATSMSKPVSSPEGSTQAKGL